jgi:hypothetical protein
MKKVVNFNHEFILVSVQIQILNNRIIIYLMYKKFELINFMPLIIIPIIMMK